MAVVVLLMVIAVLATRLAGPPPAAKAATPSPYRAQDASQLATALARLPAAFTIVRKHIDLASWFAAGGGLLVAAAVAFSLWWNRTRRIVDH